jgi:two-component system, NarL family, nitrate/nitrite response regulator NarL
VISKPRFSIVLASDFPIFRDSLKANLEKASDTEIVACAEHRNQVVPLLQTFQPKLVLLDLNVDWKELCLLLDEIHAKDNVRSLIMSDVVDTNRVLEVIQHGASGVVPRRTTPELFTKSIETVLAGDYWVARSMTSHLVHLVRQTTIPGLQPNLLAGDSAVAPSSAPAATAINSTETSETAAARFGLTRRELQIIGALVDGQMNKDIANTFGISEYTVKHHLTNIYDKLGVYNRVELVIFAINQKLCTATGALMLQP